MKYAQKKEGKRVQAYELGCGSQMEDNLIREGVIRHLENGDYELFSREAVNGRGELAHPGDYFKVDTEGERHYPYPNSREFFLANHRHIQENEYEQICKPLAVWMEGDEICEEIEYLLRTGKLTLLPDQKERYFNAILWGAPLSAARNDVLVIYNVERDESGAITGIDFNFVQEKVFYRDYNIVRK